MWWVTFGLPEIIGEMIPFHFSFLEGIMLFLEIKINYGDFQLLGNLFERKSYYRECANIPCSILSRLGRGRKLVHFLEV